MHKYAVSPPPHGSFVFFVLASFLFIALVASKANAGQIDIVGPAGSGAFGTIVRVLPNGNFVVTDPFYDEGGIADIGAVYLYDGNTLALISMLKGSTLNDQVGTNGIVNLSNGNFLVRSHLWDNAGAADAGAITWCSMTAGCNGTVSAANSLVGTTANDRVGQNGILSLSSGNFVVASAEWDDPTGPIVDAGAATWGNGSVGVVGPVTVSNSLIGGTASDLVGNLGLVGLSNGNYVVRSTDWDNPSGPVNNVGAITWGNGASGTFGVVSASNSLIGASVSDQISFGISSAGGITPLNNGNYVVSSPQWDNPSGPVTDAGAATWCNGSGPTVGVVSTANSLFGGSANDQVGLAVASALANGNYIVRSRNWDNPVGPVANVGAATWGNGLTGTVGMVSPANSMVGNIASDQLPAVVLSLNNGNYVVGCSTCDNPSGPIANAGTVTWGNGATGTFGAVNSSNSLVGTTASDSVGLNVVALNNGNYVTGATSWDNPAGPVANVGAVTWGNGNGGTVGVVSASNSLIGGTAGDAVGAVTPLFNGNYVVGSSLWDNPTGPIVDAGAATWCNGSVGTVGLVSTGNSLYGGRASDGVGTGITALSNGNYVVRSPNWDLPSPLTANVGSAAWCNGTTGRVGTLGTSGNLYGFSANDMVGSGFVTALNNGNYLVLSPLWDNFFTDLGAATWGNGASGTSGFISDLNSVIGTTAGDGVGSPLGIALFVDGNYFLSSSTWDNPTGPVTDAGFGLLGNGSYGADGNVTTTTAVVGTVASGIVRLGAYDSTKKRLYVTRLASNTVSFKTSPCSTVVSNNNDSGAGSLRQTLADACDGSTITFDPAFFNVQRTITLSSELVVDKNLTIDGPGSKLLTISGNNVGRVFNVRRERLAAIDGITITAGNANDCCDNLKQSGGGIFSAANLTLVDVIVTGNTAIGAGGGIYNSEAGTTTTITNSVISNNSGPIGGGIVHSAAALNITGSTISGNSRTSTVGGAGGIYNFGAFSLVNSTISGNTVPTGTFNGGGLYLGSGIANVINSTVTNNTAPTGTNNAGGIRSAGATLNIKNSIVAANVNNTTTADVAGTFVSGGYNIVGNVGTATGFSATGDQTGTGGSPVDPGLLPLGSYGGSTQTHALLSGSPAIDPASSNGAPATDQRGASRVGNADIGAFELNSSSNGGSYLGSLPNGTQNAPYNVPITANSGQFTYSITGGALPNGLSLTTSFVPDAVVAIAGTPTQFGVFDFAITATDGKVGNVTNYRLLVFGPTAAGASITGRVLTSDGRGIRNAVVDLTDMNGVIRRTRSSSLGYYRFDDVHSGATYVLAVNSKQYQFAPRTLNVGGDLTEVDLIGW